MGIVVEADVGQFELAVALDVYLVVRVDEDVGDPRIVEQRFERAEAQHLVLDVAHQGAPLDVVDDDAVFIEQAPDEAFQVVAYLLLGQALHAFQVDPVEQGWCTCCLSSW